MAHEMSEQEINEIMDSTTPVKQGEPEAPPPPKANTPAVRKDMAVGEKGIEVTTDAELYRLADAMFNSSTKVAGVRSSFDMMMCLQAGREMGLGPAATVASIYVVNGKPTLWGDAIVAVAMQTGEYVDHDIRIEGEGAEMRAICTVERMKQLPDGEWRTITKTESFSMAEAKTAGLTGKDLWQKYPQRMLRGKAKTYAFREAFADVMRGIQQEVDEGECGRPAFQPGNMRGAKRSDSGDAILDAVEGEPALPEAEG